MTQLKWKLIELNCTTGEPHRTTGHVKICFVPAVTPNPRPAQMERRTSRSKSDHGDCILALLS
eukprot:12400747-Karenia_brevis.AAC.1